MIASNPWVDERWPLPNFQSNLLAFSYKIIFRNKRDCLLKFCVCLQTLVRAGKGLGVGVQVIHLAAGITGASRYMGLTEYFSPQELQVCILSCTSLHCLCFALFYECSAYAYFPPFVLGVEGAESSQDLYLDWAFLWHFI